MSFAKTFIIYENYRFFFSSLNRTLFVSGFREISFTFRATQKHSCEAVCESSRQNFAFSHVARVPNNRYADDADIGCVGKIHPYDLQTHTHTHTLCRIWVLRGPGHYYDLRPLDLVEFTRGPGQVRRSLWPRDGTAHTHTHTRQHTFCMTRGNWSTVILVRVGTGAACARFLSAIHGLMASHVCTRHRMYRTVSAFSRRRSGVQ